MQFTKVFSIIALSAATVQALPQTSAGPVSVNGNYTLVSDATTKVVTGLNVFSAGNVAAVNTLVATYVASAKGDAAAAATAIGTIVGGGQAYVAALETILTVIGGCVAAQA